MDGTKRAPTHDFQTITIVLWRDKQGRACIIFWTHPPLYRRSHQRPYMLSAPLVKFTCIYNHTKLTKEHAELSRDIALEAPLISTHPLREDELYVLSYQCNL
jgi:hypothetical protein